MEVIRQLCIKSYEAEDIHGNTFKASQGNVYLTSIPKEGENRITVFSSFWVSTPKNHFVKVEEDEDKEKVEVKKDENDRFCEDCGVKMEEPNIGEIIVGYQYCEYCGRGEEVPQENFERANLINDYLSKK